MAQSKLPLIVSVLSLLVAVLSIWALFSTWNSGTSGGSRLSAATYTDDEAPEPPIAIDPGQIDYAETNRIAIDSRSVSALAVDADDKIYVAGDKAVFRFSPQGRLELRIPLSLEPTCLTVGNRQHMVPGRIYVGFVDHVEVFDANGLETAIWQGLGERARITSISSSEHYIFIADAGQNVVQRFDWEGKLLESFGGAHIEIIKD